ncbi:hypothetical protein LTR85_007683 [Meristemomyces frigidus]|nr:hypothetical protein LTR85_007683 [Meristemomyces frigidus]
MSTQSRTPLDLLKSQIDAGATDFSVFLKEFGKPPTDQDYRTAVRYAYGRLREGLEYVSWMYDRIDRSRQQCRLNTAYAEQNLLTVEELAAVKVERISSESLNVRTDLDDWIHKAKKGGLQLEIKAVVEMNRVVEVEKGRLFQVWDDATSAEKASRPAETVAEQAALSERVEAAAADGSSRR